MHLICKVSSIAERNKSKCALLEPGVVLNGANPVPVVLGMWAHFFVTYNLYPARAWSTCLLGGGPFGLFWSLPTPSVPEGRDPRLCVWDQNRPGAEPGADPSTGEGSLFPAGGSVFEKTGNILRSYKTVKRHYNLHLCCFFVFRVLNRLSGLYLFIKLIN